MAHVSWFLQTAAVGRGPLRPGCSRLDPDREGYRIVIDSVSCILQYYENENVYESLETYGLKPNYIRKI
ncbi:hypothetical protein H920_15370 [Fukomys damarensis]|uniref:Uncharacterized protein n=1 Tax=Fukomys damarensis TaxID=885580 RepID=A0A091CZA6_FUKDA|nr:hypothetical protein H920_15370 [Fukomys damarensis]